MARHGFGRGEYKYFAYPLPHMVAELRMALYPRLVAIANRWNETMGIGVRFPDGLGEFIERCHKAGQTRPSSPITTPFRRSARRRRVAYAGAPVRRLLIGSAWA
jgi:hypothetical protein